VKPAVVRAVGVVAVVLGCRGGMKETGEAATPTPPPPTPPTPPPTTPPLVAVTADAGCGPDLSGHSGADEVEGFDLDGDGDVDRVFRGSMDLHGNSDFLLFQVADGCATYLGSIRSFGFSTPRCVDPPATGTVCRMSANLRMYHDDYQESFWVLGAGGFVKDGSGRYTPGPDRKP
jgi:hypothetical protein